MTIENLTDEEFILEVKSALTNYEKIGLLALGFLGDPYPVLKRLIEIVDKKNLIKSTASLN